MWLLGLSGACASTQGRSCHMESDDTCVRATRPWDLSHLQSHQRPSNRSTMEGCWLLGDAPRLRTGARSLLCASWSPFSDLAPGRLHLCFSQAQAVPMHRSEDALSPPCPSHPSHRQLHTSPCCCFTPVSAPERPHPKCSPVREQHLFPLYRGRCWHGGWGWRDG